MNYTLEAFFWIIIASIFLVSLTVLLAMPKLHSKKSKDSGVIHHLKGSNTSDKKDRGKNLNQESFFMIKTESLATHFPIRDFFGSELGLVKAVDGVDITITKGSTFGIVGESGCGKTTLARTILGLEKSTSGSTILGSEMSEGVE